MMTMRLKLDFKKQVPIQISVGMSCLGRMGHFQKLQLQELLKRTKKRTKISVPNAWSQRSLGCILEDSTALWEQKASYSSEVHHQKQIHTHSIFTTKTLQKPHSFQPKRLRCHTELRRLAVWPRPRALKALTTITLNSTSVPLAAWMDNKTLGWVCYSVFCLPSNHTATFSVTASWPTSWVEYCTKTSLALIFYGNYLAQVFLHPYHCYLISTSTFSRIS